MGSDYDSNQRMSSDKDYGSSKREYGSSNREYGSQSMGRNTRSNKDDSFNMGSGMLRGDEFERGSSGNYNSERY